MEYERLSDRRFDALKYNIVLQGFYFSSGGFCVCCIIILFIYKVLSIVLFEPFKVVGVVVCGSVGNSKGWTCGAGTGVVGCCAGLVDSLECCVVDRVKDLWISKGKTRVRELYPKKIIPKRTSVLCPRPAIFNTIFYHFQIKKWKLFSSKKIG